MLDLPLFIPIVFILTTALTLFLTYRIIDSSNQSRKTHVFLIVVGVWLVIHALLAGQGYYLSKLDALPPRLFVLGLLPTFILMGYVLLAKAGQNFINSLSLKDLIWLSIVRIPVEFCLYWLALHKAIPELMSFAGRNFDILAGLTVPLVAYLGFKNNEVNKRVLWIWNIIGIGLLLNIIVHALLSAPFPMQQFAFDQPNIALLHFPFVWLATFVAPLVLLSHFISIYKLSKHSEQGL